MSTFFLSTRAAASAPAFPRFARSAPAKPGVPRATTERSTSSDIGMFLLWTRRIPSRPFTSGRSTTTRRAKRPGRGRAWARAADGVDLVDEDDARRVLLPLLEEIPYSRRPDAHEHLDEVGAGDREERH